MQSGTFIIIQNLTYCNFTEVCNPKVSNTLKTHWYQNCICTKPDINFHFTYKKIPMCQIILSTVTHINTSVKHLSDSEAPLLKEKKKGGKIIHESNLVMLIGLLWSTVNMFSKSATCLLGRTPRY